MDTIYREMSGGFWVYWVYAEGRRWFLSQQRAYQLIDRKLGRFVTVSA